jgi:hypothetical protein
MKRCINVQVLMGRHFVAVDLLLDVPILVEMENREMLPLLTLNNSQPGPLRCISRSDTEQPGPS